MDKLIIELADRLQIGVGELIEWFAIKRYGELFDLFIIVAAIFICYQIGKRAYLIMKAGKESDADISILDEVHVTFCYVVGVFLVVTLVFQLSTIVHAFISPEAYAIQKILGALSGS